ncbi:hypothetical protein GW17_00051890 [Ensete ventricosum]|nr:hypothetical protein GW17_00051890 [Ensete ventricosum]
MRLNHVESFYAFLLHFYNKRSEKRGGWPRPGPLQGRPAMAKPLAGAPPAARPQGVVARSEAARGGRPCEQLLVWAAPTQGGTAYPRGAVRGQPSPAQG